MNQVLPQVVKLEEPNIKTQKQRLGHKGPFQIKIDQEGMENKNTKSYEWSPVENAKYAAFIEKNCSRIEGRPHNQLWSIHQEMSKYVKTRNFRQCKLHHQKLQMSFGTISAIINSLFSEIKHFEELFIKERQLLITPNEKSLTGKVSQASNYEKFKDENDKLLKQDLIQTDCIYRKDAETDNPKTLEMKNSYVPSMMKFPISSRRQYQKKWGQCHMFFIEWSNRMNQLISERL